MAPGLSIDTVSVSDADAPPIKHPVILVPGLGGTVLKARHNGSGKEIIIWPRYLTQDIATQRFAWGDTIPDPTDPSSPYFR
ncbi:hypothetical protein KIPB_002895 [Kipferlia bialata]|uniref:Uncharacterized protein n=1 Tax=Kipferlia bialata TaxID=797122 RepID=A0A9K3CSK1_9EUKA|nr:hypothetical protein KIPB_002895 [Kipferlia bialata]|eukprot:g2895.t1